MAFHHYFQQFSVPSGPASDALKSPALDFVICESWRGVSEANFIRMKIGALCRLVAETANPHIEAYTPARREQFRSLNGLSSPFTPARTKMASGFCRRVLFFRLEIRKKATSSC
jgi:hypothetical protein